MRAPALVPSILSLSLSLSLSASSPGDARACAPAMPEGQSVRIVGEQALLIWDAAHHMEHFIRRADFSTDAPDFGFLVPTPSVPGLGEVDEGIFERLEEEIAPDVVDENSYTFLTCCTAPILSLGREAAVGSALGVSPPVTVLSEQRVAGLDASVLSASDAEALGAWLGERGYANRPELVDWLRPYVARHWTITAFRYVKQPQGGETVGSRAVRMSFRSGRPFYPYREPSDTPEESTRSLRVYLVGPGRMRARGEWGATVEHARAIEGALFRGLAPGASLEGLWLTSFLDEATTRAGRDDLDFERSPDQSVVRPRPAVMTHPITVPLPIEPLLLIGLAVFFWRRSRRAAQATDPASDQASDSASAPGAAQKPS